MAATIHVCGLGWSGSGALIDALYDTGHVVGLCGGYPDETALFRHNNRLSPTQFMTMFTQRKRLDQCGFLSLITGARLGTDNSLYRDELRYFYGQNPMNRPPYNSENFVNIPEQTLRDEVNSLFGGEQTVDAATFLRDYARWANRLVEFCHEQAGKRVVLNNDPLSRHLERIPVARDSRAIVIVVRAPEDMIADNPRIRQKPKAGLSGMGGRLLTVARLAWMKRGKIRRCIRLHQRTGHDLRIVGFEHFVRNTAYREHLIANLLEIAPDKTPAIRFRPEDSATNIGLGQQVLNRLERAIVRLICARPYRRMMHLAA